MAEWLPSASMQPHRSGRSFAQPASNGIDMPEGGEVHRVRPSGYCATALRPPWLGCILTQPRPLSAAPLAASAGNAGFDLNRIVSGEVPSMAQRISKREIKALVCVPYEQVRDVLQTGDLVFCSGSYLFSRAIQAFTRSVWSHVAIVYRDEHLQRVFVLESETGIGVRLAPLSKYLRDYHGRRRPYRGQIVVARLHTDIDDAALLRVISTGMDELTKPYDNLEILRISMRILFRVSRRTRDRKYICSELVESCYRRAGVRFQLKDNFISPLDIWLDPHVELKNRIL